MEALRRLIENKDLALCLGAALKEDLHDRYALSRMIEEVQNLYLRLYRAKITPR
jgi:hypothetical protein